MCAACVSIRRAVSPGARAPGVSRKVTTSACCSVSPTGPADAVICGLCLADLDLATACRHVLVLRSEEHTSELQSLMRFSYAVFCMKKKICIQNKNQAT